MSQNQDSPLFNLISEAKIDQVIRDSVILIQDEVQKKRGLSGTVIKGGMKMIERVRPNIIADLLYGLLPNFIEALAPFYEQYLKDDQASISFSQTLEKKSTEVANLLLSVTDQRAQKSNFVALVKVYKKLRPLAQDQIIDSLPALGQLLAKHGVL